MVGCSTGTIGRSGISSRRRVDRVRRGVVRRLLDVGRLLIVRVNGRAHIGREWVVGQVPAFAALVHPQPPCLVSACRADA